MIKLLTLRDLTEDMEININSVRFDARVNITFIRKGNGPVEIDSEDFGDLFLMCGELMVPIQKGAAYSSILKQFKSQMETFALKLANEVSEERWTITED